MMDSVIVENRIFNDVDDWLEYVDSLKQPKSDIQRTRNQYLCVKYFSNRRNCIKENILSLPATFITIVVTALRSVFFKKRENNNCDALLFVATDSKVQSIEKIGLPDEIKGRYINTISYAQRRKSSIFNGYLNRDAFHYWIKIVKKYPAAFYMNYYLLTHLLTINKLIYMYSPKAIITTETENDFATSFLTGFCENNKTKYIGVMHGENFVNPLHAYVRFSEYYVWDKFYIEQYARTGSDRNFFHVYEPRRYQINIKHRDRKNYFITYYLQGQNRNELFSIYRILSKFSENGLKCKVRIHPRATKIEWVNEIFENSSIEIEDIEEVSISESFADTEFIVSMYSTVLTEAYENGLNAVIDDLSNVKLYENLKKLKYINIGRLKLRLSMLAENYL